MSYSHRWMSIGVAWFFTVLGAAFAAAWSIEHPEFLSMSPFALGLLVSAVFIGLPLAFGLTLVQAPAFEKSLRRTGSLRQAWLASVAANAAYAAALTPLLIALTWLLGNEITALQIVWGTFVLILCSLVTSIIWLTFNALFSKAPHA